MKNLLKNAWKGCCRIKVVSLVLGFIMTALFIYGCNTPVPPGEKGINLMENEKVFDENSFINPSKKFRPMPVIHADEYSVYGVNRQNLGLLDGYGYGGVVTNVSFNMYLESEEMWESLESNVRYAIDSLGMRIWIYDELHYPSGAAGGLVLKDNQEWQAKGIVNDFSSAPAGSNFTKPYKYGHKLIIAKAFRGNGIEDINLSSETDIMEFADTNGNINWQVPSDGGYFIITQYTKNFYEGTHAVNNWAVLRHSIDVLRREPVQKFIKLTHEQYKARLKSYFGREIEAFFTDEPAMIGTYFPKPPTTPAILDQPDANIPLQKTVNFTEGIWDLFLNEYGYSLEDYSHYLFADDGETARQVRWDYYKLLAKLMETNYSKQIGDWCGDNGISFSGHWLLEENIYMHPIFNGNLIRNMSHQQIPGIDLLTSYPSKALNWACTAAKFASSAAHLNGGYKTFSEISSAFDSSMGNIYQVIGAAGVQAATGINNFACYYRFYDWSAEENRLFTDSLGRLSYMVDKGVHLAKTAVYYPIESIYGDTLPPMDVNNPGSGYGAEAVNISNNFTNLCRGLTGNQIDFDILDSANLNKCTFNDGKILTPYGEEYSALIIPSARALEKETLDALLKASEKGVKIIMQNIGGILPPFCEDREGYLQGLYDLSCYTNLEIIPSLTSLMPRLKALGLCTVTLGESAYELAAARFKFKDKSLYMFVNTEERQKTYNIETEDTGKIYKTWDIYTGRAENLSNLNINGNKSLFTITIPAGRVALVTIE